MLVVARCNDARILPGVLPPGIHGGTIYMRVVYASPGWREDIEELESLRKLGYVASLVNYEEPLSALMQTSAASMFIVKGHLDGSMDIHQALCLGAAIMSCQRIVLIGMTQLGDLNGRNILKFSNWATAKKRLFDQIPPKWRKRN